MIPEPTHYLFRTLREVKTDQYAAALHRHANDYNLYSDYGGRVIDFPEYIRMVKAGELKGHVDEYDSWKVKPGGHGLIMRVGAKQYTTTTDKLGESVRDFQTGWYEAMASIEATKVAEREAKEAKAAQKALAKAEKEAYKASPEGKAAAAALAAKRVARLVKRDAWRSNQPA